MLKLKRSITMAMTISAAAMVATPIVLASQQSAPQQIEVAFVLDTTGSMVELIDGAKRKIWSIANTIVDINPKAEIKMALIGYRDYGDEYVIKKFDMSADIQGLYSNLTRLRADGGGDMPEAVNEALAATIDKITWSKQKDTRQIVFLVGDAPPHMDYANGPKYQNVVKKASQKGITVNAVQAGNSQATRAVWQEIAQLGQGRYIPIPQDGGQVIIVETPYDDDIIILQNQLDRTVIPYGNEQRQKRVRTIMKEKAAAPAPSKVDNAGFYSKRKVRSEVVTSDGDLIADIQNKDISVDKIKEAELPDVLKDKSLAERKTYINERIKSRKELQDKMSKLVAKRDQYVAGQKKNQPKAKKDSFDQVVVETLKTQLR